MISIILPVFNCEKFIAEAIESILSQSLADFELIISNNNSNDHTEQICKKFAAKDKRIKLILCQERGISNALNKAIDTARFPFIARMDADDICFKNRLEIQYEFLLNNPNIDIVGSEAIGFSSKERIRNLFYVPKDNRSCQNYLFSGLSPFIHPTILGRSSVFKEFKYNSKYCGAEDYELFLRMSINGVRFKNIQKPLLFYRTNDLKNTKYIAILKNAYLNFFGVKNLKKYEKIAYSLEILQNSYGIKEISEKQLLHIEESIRLLISFEKRQYIILIIRFSTLLYKLNKKLFLKNISKLIGILMKFPIDFIDYIFLRFYAQVKSMIIKKKYASNIIY